MKCKEVLNEIVPQLYGELTPQKYDEYKRHMQICSNCARFSQKAKGMIEIIKANTRKDIGADITKAISEKLKKEGMK
jgi:hypothetical protein